MWNDIHLSSPAWTAKVGYCSCFGSLRRFSMTHRLWVLRVHTNDKKGFLDKRFMQSLLITYLVTKWILRRDFIKRLSKHLFSVLVECFRLVFEFVLLWSGSQKRLATNFEEFTILYVLKLSRSKYFIAVHMVIVRLRSMKNLVLHFIRYNSCIIGNKWCERRYSMFPERWQLMTLLLIRSNSSKNPSG